MRDIYGSDYSSISSSSSDQTQGPVNQNIVPSTSDIYDVGTVAKRFRNGVFKSCTVNGSDVLTTNSVIYNQDLNTNDNPHFSSVITNTLAASTDTPVSFFENAYEINTNSPLNAGYLGSAGNISAVGTITSQDSVLGAKFIKTDGTGDQYLMADGTVDSNNYATVNNLATTNTNVSALANDLVNEVMNRAAAFALKVNLSGNSTLTGNLNVIGSIKSTGFDADSELTIGTASATSIEIGRSSTISTLAAAINVTLSASNNVNIGGDYGVNISAGNGVQGSILLNSNNGGALSIVCSTLNVNSYTLPTNTPTIGQHLVCTAAGSTSWATPSPSAFAAIYPFSTASRTGFLPAASRTYCVTYTMAANISLSQASVCLGSAGSDSSRIGVYRGDLTTATLVGQTLSIAPTSNYYTRTLTAVVGQSLTFTIGEQVVVVYTTSGGTTTPAYRTMTSNIALATLSTNTYTAGLPSTIAGVITQTVTTTRICLELA